MSSGAVVLVAFAAGLFVIVAVVSDWNWFFEHPKAKFLVDAFGRNGARIFYGVLGCALLLIGLYCHQFQA
jgi:hypothetical protein